MKKILTILASCITITCARGAGIVSGTISANPTGSSSATTANQLVVSGTTNGLDGVYVPTTAFNIVSPVSHYEPVWTNHAVAGLLAYQNAGGGAWELIGGGSIFLN